jgi:hypothetical protein
MADKKTFIRYQKRNPNHNDIEYGTLCTPQRKDKIKVNNEVWLGRVIDKDNRIFFKRDIGYYQLTPENEFRELIGEELQRYEGADIDKNTKTGRIAREKSEKNRHMISLSASFVLYNYIKQEHLDRILNFLSPEGRDHIISLVIYQLTKAGGYSFAEEWYNSNIIKFLCPNVTLQLDYISDLLAEIGSEKFYELFFTSYIEFFRENQDFNDLLLGDPWLSHGNRITYTSINDYYTVINDKGNIIPLISDYRGFPIYYYYNYKENIDHTTLDSILYDLRNYYINVHRLVLHGDYYSNKIINELNKSNIPFMITLPTKDKIFDDLIRKYLPNLINKINKIKVEQRDFYIIKDTISLLKGKISAFVYIYYDDEAKIREYNDYMNNYYQENISKDELDFELSKHGISIVISTINFQESEVLSYYFTRQARHNFIDFLNNDQDIFRLYSQSEKIFSGHLMISFIATVILYLIDRKLKEQGKSFYDYLPYLNLILARVTKNKIIPSIPTKQADELLKALGITLPDQIPLEKS